MSCDLLYMGACLCRRALSALINKRTKPGGIYSTTVIKHGGMPTIVPRMRNTMQNLATSVSSLNLNVVQVFHHWGIARYRVFRMAAYGDEKTTSTAAFSRNFVSARLRSSRLECASFRLLLGRGARRFDTVVVVRCPAPPTDGLPRRVVRGLDSR
jgi:hypothetical protein